MRGERGAQTHTASDHSQIKFGLVYRGFRSVGFSIFWQWLFIHCFFFTPFLGSPKGWIIHSIFFSNLLLFVRLLVSRSDEGPLLVFAISIVIFMSSIHFSISVSELHWKNTQMLKVLGVSLELNRQDSQPEGLLVRNSPVKSNVKSLSHVSPGVLPNFP